MSFKCIGSNSFEYDEVYAKLLDTILFSINNSVTLFLKSILPSVFILIIASSLKSSIEYFLRVEI